MGIDRFFKKCSVIDRSEKLLKGKSKKERRNIESKLFKPKTIPQYCGKFPGKSSIESRTIKIICETENDVELIKRHFKVSEYIELNIRDISLLLRCLDALENGSLEYDKEKKALFFVTDQDEKIRL